MLAVGVMLADSVVARMIFADDSLAVGQKSPRVPPRIVKNEQIGGNFPLNRKKSAFQGELFAGSWGNAGRWHGCWDDICR